MIFIDKPRQHEPYFGENISQIKHKFKVYKFDLATQIKYSIQQYFLLIQKPLRNFNKTKSRFPNQLKKLSFVYASLYMLLLGNITTDRIYDDRCYIPTQNYVTFFYTEKYFKRVGDFAEISTKMNDGTLEIEKQFSILRFVSCGTKGITPFPFVEFLSVFDTRKWTFVVLAIICISFSIHVINGETKTFDLKNNNLHN